MKSIKQLLIMFVLVLSLTTQSTVPILGSATTVSASAIRISNTSISIVKGKTKQLKISGTPKAVKWSSSNKAIAAVSSKGLVSAKKVGKALITAKVNGKTFQCKVTIKKAPVQKKTMVWLSATGEKYHRKPNCGRMNPNTARKISLTDARKKGYTACSKCF